MAFFDEDLLLSGDAARAVYNDIKCLPIIDYHCHLNEAEIACDKHFADIGELWLGGDHYKWRAMRMCGVPEELVTGGRSSKDKFLAYASIMPKLIGNPLYYWTHMELALIFGIHTPLNADSAEEIWTRANARLADTGVVDLLKQFGVEYIATTDDPFSSLERHGDIAGVKVRPTFRTGVLRKGWTRSSLKRGWTSSSRAGASWRTTVSISLRTRRISSGSSKSASSAAWCCNCISAPSAT